MGHPAHDQASPHRAAQSDFERHRPEDTALYQTVATHWPDFLERAQDAGGLPRFVIQEFNAYLACGMLDQGCLHLQCRDCGHSQLVAFSCKRRGFCPSCIGRRMTDTAIHLEQNVFPEVPVRHWICSLPWGLRALLGYDAKLCSEVISAFMTELSRSLRWRAKQEFGLARMSDAHTGAVAAVQRTDSALRLNVHAHILCLDGVYIRDADGLLVFHPLPTPSAAQVADIARRTAERVEKILQAHGRSLDPEMASDEPHQLELDTPGLAACYQAAARGVGISGERAGQPPLRLVESDHRPDVRFTEPDEPVANVRGINLYAKQVVDGRDRKQLERLCKYITRPPVAQDRLEQRPDGRLELRLKSTWRDGTRAILLEPHDLMARLVAAIPLPERR